MSNQLLKLASSKDLILHLSQSPTTIPACMLSHFSLCDPMDCSLLGSSVHGKNTGVGCHALLQGIFTTQGSNPLVQLQLLHCRQILHHSATREACLVLRSYAKPVLSNLFFCHYVKIQSSLSSAVATSHMCLLST